ncbi:MAG: TrmH family RNA methyltransferase, partial [Acidimicrobiales bacterium]
EGVMERVADTVTPQPILAVAPFLDVVLAELAGATMLVVCVDVRDPGNAGGVLRSAEAAGADGVVLCDGSVDLYNPKTVRASAGALFHLRLVAGGEATEVLGQIGSWGMRRLAAQARGGRAHTSLDLSAPVAFVLGNEASGLGAELSGCVDEAITIAMRGRAESLNVGMTAALLCFEAARQREGGGTR